MMILEVVKSLRIQQWIKNLWVFAALIFSQNVFDLHLLIKTICNSCTPIPTRLSLEMDNQPLFIRTQIFS